MLHQFWRTAAVLGGALQKAQWLRDWEDVYVVQEVEGLSSPAPHQGLCILGVTRLDIFVEFAHLQKSLAVALSAPGFIPTQAFQRFLLAKPLIAILKDSIGLGMAVRSFHRFCSH
jgi:hypothetical protein